MEQSAIGPKGAIGWQDFCRTLNGDRGLPRRDLCPREVTLFQDNTRPILFGPPKVVDGDTCDGNHGFPGRNELALGDATLYERTVEKRDLGGPLDRQSGHRSPGSLVGLDLKKDMLEGD